MDNFRNVKYDYKDQHDTFVARGLQLNMIVDKLNSFNETEGGLYTFTNGLTNTDGIITLGGELTGETIIEGETASESARFTMSADGFEMWSYADTNYLSSNGYAMLIALGSGIDPSAVMKVSDGSWQLGIQISVNSGITITDQISSVGLKYFQDYSINGKVLGLNGDRWIPDWKAVREYNTASNGLTMTTGNVVLGGALTQTTNIALGATYQLEVDGDNGVDRSSRLWVGSSYVGMYSYLDTGGSASSGFYEIKATHVGASILASNGAQSSNIIISTTAMGINDNINSRGFSYGGDYAQAGKNVAGGRWIPDVNHIRNDVTGVMHVATTYILYTDQGVETALLTLPIGAILWDIKVLVVSAFNDFTGDFMEIGNDQDGVDFYDTSINVGVVEWKTLTLGNIPQRFTVATEIRALYEGGTQDADQGEARIYLYYTIDAI